MDDYVKTHQGVPLFDDEWQKRQGLVVDGHDRLTFTITGVEKASVVYVSKNGNKYEAPFTRNAFLLLQQLVQNPKKVFAAADFMFRKKRGGENDSLDLEPADERRVRDTIQHVRGKLELTEKKSEDFFIVGGKRFGIRCAVELRQES